MTISDQRARKVTISRMMKYFEYNFNVFSLSLSVHLSIRTKCTNNLLDMLKVVYHVQVYMLVDNL